MSKSTLYTQTAWNRAANSSKETSIIHSIAYKNIKIGRYSWLLNLTFFIQYTLMHFMKGLPLINEKAKPCTYVQWSKRKFCLWKQNETRMSSSEISMMTVMGQTWRHLEWSRGASVVGMWWPFPQHVSDIGWYSTAMKVVSQTKYSVCASYFAKKPMKWSKMVAILDDIWRREITRAT